MSRRIRIVLGGDLPEQRLVPAERQVETRERYLTWFKFAPAETPVFDELLHRLREIEERSSVERDVEVRLARLSG